MTGFGSASVTKEWGTLTLELSSVNHRYQEIYVRLPRELASWEPWFHQQLRNSCRRGKIQARADIIWAASSLAVSFNKEVLISYYKEISALRDTLGDERGITLDALVNLPGVLDTSGRSGLGSAEGTQELLGEILEASVKNWNAMRINEGGHLKEAVDGHLFELERYMTEIERAWPGAKDAAFEAMTSRLSKALEASGISPDESRFAQEALILADRWDISEEIARLASHIAKFREIAEGRESEGRKLDFLVQEMNREANTINSKVTNSEIRWLAVEAKAAIERIREQIQNLE
jgi:uncharacterized protein (TIGR00255 family)